MSKTGALSLAAATFLWAASAQAALVTFVVPLDGAVQEVNAAGVVIGDLDGIGTATLTIDTVALTIDWLISTSNIALPPVGAHIHNAVAGTTGPILIDFDAALLGSGLFDPDLAALLANPTEFYVNVHNQFFPAGAIRGQLPVPEPGTALLMGAGLALLGASRRRGTR